MMGRMTTVLKIARQINQASWLLRALYHMPITLQTPSQSATRIRTGISTPSQTGNECASIFTAPE